MILAISDLHGNLPQTPESEVLLIAGDICPDFGFPPDKASYASQLHWLDTSFRQWLTEQPTKHIIGIAGNHDFVFEDRDAIEGLNLPWVYLQDSQHEHEGIKYYGLPWVPNLRSWAFYGNNSKLDDVYGDIPDDTDIIISHGPPSGILDRVGIQYVGALQARSAIERISPKAFICGHIHEGFGHRTLGDTSIFNVSYVDEYYVPRDQFVFIDENYVG